jgi:hypothetical protein
MKRASMFMAVLLLCAAAILSPSCEKNQQHTTITETKIPEQVSAWLEKQKSPTLPNKAANINLLKEHLDYTGIRYEQFSEDQQYLFIPVDNGFTKAGKIKDDPIVSLLLVVDRSGTIKKGNLVLYFPGEGETARKIPTNTFHNIRYGQKVECNGKFRFMSVSGSLLYELVYKNGVFYSYAKPEVRNNDGQAVEPTAQATLLCLDWYLITRVYVNGLLISETSQYLGTTCSECDSPINEGHQCPDADGGGGGGGENGPECCLPQDQMVWTSNNSSYAGPWQCDPPTIVNGIQIKNCKLKWEFRTEYMGWYNWKYWSYIYAVCENVNGAWRFRSINPAITVQRSGLQPGCATFNCTANLTSTISPDKSSVYLTIDFYSTAYIDCLLASLNPQSGSISWSYPAPQ